MEPDTDPVDDVTAAVLSGSHYERLRLERYALFGQRVEHQLLYQVGLLWAIAALPVVYALFPATVSQYLPATSPGSASPKVLLLALVGGAIQVGTASVLVATTLYRLRHDPVTERQARRILDLETLAATIGLGTGGLAVVVSVAYFLMGLAGPDAVARYIALNDANPYAATGIGLTISEVAVGAFAAGAALFVVRQFITLQLTLMRLERR